MSATAFQRARREAIAAMAMQEDIENNKSPQRMNVAELKEYLLKAGIEFDDKATKKSLLQLLTSMQDDHIGDGGEV